MPERLDHSLELPPAADEGSVQPAMVRSRALQDAQESVGTERYSLPLQSQRLDGLDFDGVACEPMRPLADQDVARVGRLLEPGGDVDGVARCEPLAGRGLAGDDLTGVHPDPHLEANAELLLELRVRASSRSLISRAARSARRASSSWSRGIPKTAMTASPMNFSTVPP